MEDSFALLEEKVHKAADVVKRLRKENHSLGEEMARAKAAMQEAEKKIATLQKEKAASPEQTQVTEALRRELDELTRERTEVRNRIAKLVEVLEGLD
jgi:predicted RNase H-like nuclease (RuvC/YqgF family)